METAPAQREAFAENRCSIANKRKHIRTRLDAKVKLTHDSLGTVIANLRDFSEGGLYVLFGDWAPPPIGASVRVQIVELQDDAPIVSAQVVRIDAQGIGLRFLSNEGN